MTSSFSAVSSQLPDDPKLQAILAQFAAAECCWFSSVRPDGRVHLAPIWHIWHRGQVFVVTQGKSVRARNIVHNPSVSAALPDPLNPVIFEGTAAFAQEAKGELQPLFLAKYNWDIVTDHEYDSVIAVTPHKIMAWGSHGDQRWNLH